MTAIQGPLDDATLRQLYAIGPNEPFSSALKAHANKDLASEDRVVLEQELANYIWLYAKAGREDKIDALRAAWIPYQETYLRGAMSLFFTLAKKVKANQLPEHALELTLGAHRTAAVAYELFAQIAQRSKDYDEKIAPCRRGLYDLYSCLCADYGATLPPIAEVTCCISLVLRLQRHQIPVPQFLTYLTEQQATYPKTAAWLEKWLADHIKEQYETVTVPSRLFLHELLNVKDPGVRACVLAALERSGYNAIAFALSKEWSPDQTNSYLTAFFQAIPSVPRESPEHATMFLLVASSWHGSHRLPLTDEPLVAAIKSCRRLYDALKADSKPEENMDDGTLMQQAAAMTYAVYMKRWGRHKHHTFQGIELPRTFRILPHGGTTRSGDLSRLWSAEIYHQNKGLPKKCITLQGGILYAPTQTVNRGSRTKMSWVTCVWTDPRQADAFIIEPPTALLKTGNDTHLERRGIDWFDLLVKGLSPAEMAKLLAGLGSALECFVKEGRVHKDLKPENLLLMPDGTVRIIDQEFAVAVGSPVDIIGTARYISPEQYVTVSRNERLVASHAGDVFAIGCTLITMARDTIPWYEASDQCQKAALERRPLPPVDPIINGIHAYRDQLRQSIDQLPPTELYQRALLELTRECLHVDPCGRPPMAELCQRLQAFVTLP